MDNNNEHHQCNLMQMISDCLHDVISVHGEIDKISRQGNSAVIFFKDGSIYKQPFVSKQTSKVIADNIK